MLSKRTPIGVKLSKDMNATIGIIELLVPLLFVGLTLSLGAIIWALSTAPEGYEDEKGFHSKHSPPSISHSSDVSLLRPHNAG